MSDLVEPTTDAADPMSVAFLEGHCFKEAARKSLEDLELYRRAADCFHRAGKLAEASEADSATDEEKRSEARVFAPYYHYEAQRCLAAYFYEKRDTDEAERHYVKGNARLGDHISRLEQEVSTAPQAFKARLISLLETARFYQGENAAGYDAIPARAAWDGGRFVDAIDLYRRMAERYEQLLPQAKRLKNPAYERITFGNIIGWLANCSAAMVQQHFAVAEVSHEGMGTVVPVDLACDILRHLFKAYLHGMAAFEANPEWEQYRDGAIQCRRNIEELLHDNKDAWGQVYPRFLGETDFIKIMAAVDMDRFRALTQSGVVNQMPSSIPLRILFLAANPKDSKPLRLGEEIRTIEERLRLSKHASHFEIKQAWAVRVKDLQEVLLRHDPHIVHFSGHGSACGEIILENSQGDSHPVEPAALSDLFKLLKGSSIRGVVLNSCGSLSQGEAIIKHVEFVVGMSDEIGDDSAIAFAAGFYQSFGYGKSVKTSFDLACNQIHLEGLADEDLPKLLTRKESDPNGIVFVDATARPAT